MSDDRTLPCRYCSLRIRERRDGWVHVDPAGGLWDEARRVFNPFHHDAEPWPGSRDPVPR